MEVKFEIGDRAKASALAHTAAFFAAVALAVVVFVLVARSWAGGPIVMFALAAAFAGAFPMLFRDAVDAEARHILRVLAGYFICAAFASALSLSMMRVAEDNLVGIELAVMLFGMGVGVVFLGFSFGVVCLAKFIYKASLSRQPSRP